MARQLGSPASMRASATNTLEGVDEWDELADRAEATSPWLRPGWILAWWRAFGRGALEIVSVRREGRLSALVPLERTRAVLSSTANYHTPSFGILAEDEVAARQLAEELMARRARRLHLAFVSAETLSSSDLASRGRRAGYRILERTLESSPYVETNRDWEAYQSGLDGKMLRELRRRRRKLESRGRLEVAVEDGTSRLDELLDEGFRVEAAAWKGRNRTAIISDPKTEGFYREVAHWAARRGSLRLAFLRLDGQPLAFDFAIEDERCHHLLKTGYDPAYRALAPAMLLRYEMLARAFELRLRSYEFGGADELWKLQWSDRTRKRLLLQAFAGTPSGFVDWTAWTYGRAVAKRVVALARRGR
jgi:CelD/BcsL family acetyltransferase involved in cellulose biosynthesis